MTPNIAFSTSSLRSAVLPPMSLAPSVVSSPDSSSVVSMISLPQCSPSLSGQVSTFVSKTVSTPSKHVVSAPKKLRTVPKKLRTAPPTTSGSPAIMVRILFTGYYTLQV